MIRTRKYQPKIPRLALSTALQYGIRTDPVRGHILTPHRGTLKFTDNEEHTNAANSDECWYRSRSNKAW